MMCEVLKSVTTSTTLALLPNGSVVVARTLPVGALADISPEEARPFLLGGHLAAVQEVRSVTRAEMERGCAEVVVTAKTLEKEQAALLESQRGARDVESKTDDRAMLQKIWDDVRYHEHRVRRARDAESSARAALIELEKRDRVTQARAELAAAAARREAQARAIPEVVALVLALKSKLDQVAAMGGPGSDLSELQAKITGALEASAKAASPPWAPHELKWLFR
jgi:hypothetical protein